MSAFGIPNFRFMCHALFTRVVGPFYSHSTRLVVLRLDISLCVTGVIAPSLWRPSLSSSSSIITTGNAKNPAASSK